MKRFLRISFVLLFSTFITTISFAGEGMWLPIFLKSLNEAEMQGMGMRMTAEDIYSVNQGSLKDAIVHFGGFCTAEVISDQGLLLTNHHCGYGQIQAHTTLANNYIKDGFWAASLKHELQNPGLFAKFIVRIDDVSKIVLAGVKDDMDEKTRQSTIDKNIAALKEKVTLKKFEEIDVKPFFEGNQYFSITTITYPDVRLVGAPPEMIGKFGSDTDNWVWPRHTGDFSIFRIYADENNEPAEYSENNVPFKPKHHLPVSLDGVEPNDFTLVFGFPGSTNEYLPSYAISQIVDVLNPAKIQIRDTALKIVDTEMRKDPEVKIQYASKFARIANYWKKWIGESQGIKATNGIGRKQEMEKEFMKKVNAKKSYKKRYSHILDDFKNQYDAIESYALMRDYYNEVVGRNIEIMRVAAYAKRLVERFENNGEEAYGKYKDVLISRVFDDFYKNYRPEIDQKVFAALMEMYDDNAKMEIDLPITQLLFMLNTKDYKVMANHLYSKSAFTDKEKFYTILAQEPHSAITQLMADPLYQFANELSSAYNEKISAKFNEINEVINKNQRVYMKALMEVFPDKPFYPDANSTMRVTYGKVDGYMPRDAVTYTPVTYLDGIIEKHVEGDYEFHVPQRLRKLYDLKDYGQYAAKNGKVPVCFIGTNHTTGGNSGSPAIDAHGNLIGLNFDRAWEGTMSDYNYDASICRNIMVDIRYVLFIIDKYAGARRLIDEMTLVHPKEE
jgi:peptidase S46-like protein